MSSHLLVGVPMGTVVVPGAPVGAIGSMSSAGVNAGWLIGRLRCCHAFTFPRVAGATGGGLMAALL